MGTRLFVGNLSYSVTEQELREAFTGHGIEIRSVKVALDRETGRPRGFAFVETETEDGSRQSIDKLTGQILQGRPLMVQEAQARPAPGAPRPAGGFGGPPSGPRPGGFSGPPRPGGFGSGPGGPPRGPGMGGPPPSFGPPRGPGSGSGADGRIDKVPGGPRRDRPDKKKSTRPKPEERERGNWHWKGGKNDDD